MTTLADRFEAKVDRSGEHHSIAELWTMQAYLQPDVLQPAKAHAFDSWAAAFGRTHTALELAPDDSSYRMQTRFARCHNLTELLTMYRQAPTSERATSSASPRRRCGPDPRVLEARRRGELWRIGSVALAQGPEHRPASMAPCC